MSIRKPWRSALTILFASAALCYGQDPAPSPTPTPAPQEDGRVVKITTALIQLDVTVTDKKGKVVTDIRPEEIEIYENGVRQQITGFSFVANPQPKLKKDRKVDDPAAIPEPPLILRPNQVRRTFALVVDDLTLSFASVASTRAALKRFVDEQMQDGDLVGILRTGAGIGALQQFTSDKRQLYAAIDRVRWNPKGVGKFGSFDPIEPTALETLRRTGETFTDAEDLRAEREFLRSSIDYRESIFTTGTVGALKYIVGGMSELPGRKSVILFSDGLKIFSRIEGGAVVASRALDFMKQLVDEANRKSVIFYTLDARGLEYTGFTACDEVLDPVTRNDFQVLPSLQQRLSDRAAELIDSQQGLQYIAEETGGFAYINQNDLTAGINKVLEDQSYYLVAYQPDGETFDPATRKFNKIEIRVERDGVDVRHRSGFFAGEVKEEKLLVDVNYPTKIMRALTSPFALNAISVKLNALFGYTPKRGYYIHSFLHIDAEDLVFRRLPNGDHEATFQILAISYGDNGMPMDSETSTGSTIIKDTDFERVRRDGFAYSFIFPVKKPGAYQMRVALFDRGSKEVGSANQFVDVPNLKKEGVTLGGIVLENVSKEFWSSMAGGAARVPARAGAGPFDKPDPKYSTANRIFRRGSVLRYGVEVFNTKSAAENASNIRVQTRVFHDRKLVFSGEELPLARSAFIQPEVLNHTDAVEIGQNLLPGDYVLQIVVTDLQAKKKKRIATQYVQFEVIE